jgi:hypothetical protein
MKPSKLSLGSAAELGGILLIPASLAIANGDSACDDACVVELRELIDAQQRQLQQQAEMLNALQQRVESIATQSSVAVSGGVKDQPGVVKSGNDKVKLSISGQVNRGVLFTDDGKDTDVFFVDNDNSSTRVRFIGEAKPLDVLTIGTDIEVQFESNSTAAVNQDNQSNVGPNNFTKRKLKDIGTTKALTVREMMAKHRSNPTCSACHAVMDPLGFALENFDATGMWRDRDRYAGTDIDSAGELPDGTAINGPDDLRQALLRRPDQFVQTFVENLLTYAMGRTREHYDMPTVRKIVRDTAAQDYKLSAIVQAVVNTEQFKMRRVPQPTLSASK